MKPCAWRSGCVVDVADDEDHCSYHRKVLAGLIQTTRGESASVVDVELTSRERAGAEEARSRYFEQLLAQLGGRR